MQSTDVTHTRPALIALVLAAGCGGGSGVGERLDDLTTVTLGEGELAPVVVERGARLGVDRLPACIEVSVGIPNTNASLEIADTASGCALILHEPDLLLLDQSGALRVQQQAGRLDVDGVKSGSVELQQFVLRDGAGAPLDLSSRVASVSLYLAGQTVLAEVGPARLQQGEPLRRPLPASVVAEVKRAVRDGAPATIEAAFQIVLEDASRADLPDALSLGVVLQPRIQVDVVDAVL